MSHSPSSTGGPRKPSNDTDWDDDDAATQMMTDSAALMDALGGDDEALFAEDDTNIGFGADELEGSLRDEPITEPVGDDAPEAVEVEDSEDVTVTSEPSAPAVAPPDPNAAGGAPTVLVVAGLVAWSLLMLAAGVAIGLAI